MVKLVYSSSLIEPVVGMAEASTTSGLEIRAR